MKYEEITTGVPEWDTINNSGESAIQNGAASVFPSDCDSVVFVADGEYEDPRQAFDVRVVEHHGEKINAVQKLQRTVTGLLPDGTTIIVSAFGEKSRLLNNLKLGGTYTFKGKYKEKTEMFRGKEKTSRFLNL